MSIGRKAPKVNIGLYGPSLAGKSELLRALVPSYTPVDPISYGYLEFKDTQPELTLSILDTSGKERFKNIARSCWKESSIAVFVVNGSRSIQNPDRAFMIEAIRYLPAHNARILVINESLPGSQNEALTPKEIDELAVGLGVEDKSQDIVYVSAKGSRGLSELKKLLFQKAKPFAYPEDFNIQARPFADHEDLNIIFQAVKEEFSSRSLVLSNSRTKKNGEKFKICLQAAEENMQADIVKNKLEQAQALRIAKAIANLAQTLVKKVAERQKGPAEVKDDALDAMTQFSSNPDVQAYIKKSARFGQIAGMLLGAALGVFIGVLLGTFTGPAGAFAALALGKAGATLGASLGVILGGVSGHLLGAQWSLWRHPLSRLSQAATKIDLVQKTDPVAIHPGNTPIK